MITVTLKIKEDKKEGNTKITKTISKNKPSKKEETCAIVLNNELINLLQNLGK